MVKLKKKYFLIGFVVSVLILLAACGNSDSDSSGNDENSDLLFSGGAQGSVWNLVNSVIADHLEDEVPGVRGTVVAGGGVGNIIGLESEEFDIAMSYSNNAFAAINGQDSFEEVHENFSAIANIGMAAPYQMTVRANSNFEQMEDLRDARVSPGVSGFAGEEVTRTVLDLYDMSYDDFSKVEFIEYNEGISLIQDDHLDAFAPMSPDPVASIQELAATGSGVRVLPISDEVVEQLIEINEGFSPYVLKANTYNGQDEDVNLFATNTVLYVRNTLPDEIVEAILNILFDNQEEFANLHPQLEDLSPENAVVGVGAPLHPVAKQYYRDQGVLD